MFSSFLQFKNRSNHFFENFVVEQLAKNDLIISWSVLDPAKFYTQIRQDPYPAKHYRSNQIRILEKLCRSNTDPDAGKIVQIQHRSGSWKNCVDPTQIRILEKLYRSNTDPDPGNIVQIRPDPDSHNLSGPALKCGKINVYSMPQNEKC